MRVLCVRLCIIKEDGIEWKLFCTVLQNVWDGQAAGLLCNVMEWSGQCSHVRKMLASFLLEMGSNKFWNVWNMELDMRDFEWDF